MTVEEFHTEANGCIFFAAAVFSNSVAKPTTISGLVRGGSGGSADPPKILEPVEKKLENDILS